ncbi:putative endopeptidase p60 [Streptomyces hundungensis]|uniref:Putative endopeptidase p60 n=1 Tax=Streptomyces hundungensis TaxID=1077946 RepID=A0A387HL66_9ACTN|nr:C40 family peptidase [Streptomyces hundungensis]AYG84264.1 putative endopeptidase p60 [Streptomyces hundungensis]
MTAQTYVPSLAVRLGTVCVLTLAVTGASTLAPGIAPEASAAAVASRALHVAASKKGSPYQYGATGPHRFDCSGLTLYSFKEAGRKLPRSAQQQYNSSRHVTASSRKAGDLVFFHSGRRVYHVGIYAGNGRIWHSPKTGDVVRLDRIWSSAVWYGRVG